MIIAKLFALSANALKHFGTIRRYYNTYDALYYTIFCWQNKAETRKKEKEAGNKFDSLFIVYKSLT